MTIDLPAAVADDWRRLGTQTEKRRLSLMTITAETTVFEHRPTADALERLRASGSIPARSLFLIELQLNPSLSTMGLSPSDALGMAAPKARTGFVETIEDDGIIVGDERTSEHIDRPDGTVGHLTVFEADYPVDTDSAADDDGDADAATIDAEAHIAIWPATDTYVMAGGLVPLEAPDEPATLEAALDVDPARDREAIVDLFRGLDLEATDED
ncbi:hypothetical protein BDK88_0371 [Natrinema hispanicum]|uniref:Uncharacterized protein n=1 Tax=Natrinema hispanicum TaxID=392421 RepID=A0A482YHX6_9EURY|nr:hypothetical protein [Natrinema hispanicum]RZV11492.1 hypothetical protein BDK88_0371 [Natrinema hispanicum]